jgi:hypothetical protein
VPGNPREQEDFSQAPDGSFFYQINFLGGRHSPGGAVPDFVVMRGPKGHPLVIRLQGEWQHVFTIDIFEQHILVSDASARRVIADALQGISWVGPIVGGNPVRVRQRS